jgi:hypothetical protein
MKPTTLCALLCVLFSKADYAQLPTVILGRPTDHSITASVLANGTMQYFIEYGTQSGNYSGTTSELSNTPGIPDEIEIPGLAANTQYFYRLNYRPNTFAAYQASPEYHFITQRPPGSAFTFTIEADEHLYDHKGTPEIYNLTLQNQAAANPDFMLSLGDMFGDDHEPFTITEAELDSLHKYYRPFLGSICHSIPFYFCLGNHEGENDYYMAQTPPNNLAIWGTKYRQLYYPNPFPDGFYTGNEQQEEYGIGYPENYYAWTWGDALFVVIDVYRDQCDTSAIPHRWAWSLGNDQYFWLKETLENSDAQYKFVFGHHVSGWDRGAAALASEFEWGGNNQNGSWGFDTYRPDLPMPIHQLMVQNGVNVFFQGHDHVFAHEELDGMVYQTLPMAADSSYEIGFLANADAYLSDTLRGTGNLEVLVSPQCMRIDFVSAWLPEDTLDGLHHNGDILFSYSFGDCSATQITETTAFHELKVYPIPADDYLVVEAVGFSRQGNIVVKNATGEEVMQSTSTKIDVSRLPDGVYFVSCTTQLGVETKRCIIHH